MTRVTVAIITLGCAKNSVDSEIMQQIINHSNYELTENIETANVIIVNTCGFIDDAKTESIETIIDIAEHKQNGHLKKIIAAGCLAQRYQQELLTEMPELDAIVGTSEFTDIIEVIQQALNGERPVRAERLDLCYDSVENHMSERQLKNSAYIKIAEGCDNCCTFCIIPSLRGKYRSRSIASIVREVTSLASRGVKEFNLVAQDSSVYGIDNTGHPQIVQLLSELNAIAGVSWIRLLYVYPSNVTESLIEAIASLDKVCKYFEIPLQHNHKQILKRMNRPGRETDIDQLINNIRTKIPDSVIRTTIIAGFPGETEEQYQQLVNWLKTIELDRVGVFAYSQEEGTAAAKLDGQIEQAIKEKRAQNILQFQPAITEKRNRRFIGKTMPFLVESYDGEATYAGRLPIDAPDIDCEVFVTATNLQIGQIVPVKITHVLKLEMFGEVATC